eukprot:1130731-Prorocentrum_minimum.AAC.2
MSTLCTANAPPRAGGEELGAPAAPGLYPSLTPAGFTRPTPPDLLPRARERGSCAPGPPRECIARKSDTKVSRSARFRPSAAPCCAPPAAALPPSVRPSISATSRLDSPPAARGDGGARTGGVDPRAPEEPGAPRPAGVAFNPNGERRGTTSFSFATTNRLLIAPSPKALQYGLVRLSSRSGCPSTTHTCIPGLFSRTAAARYTSFSRRMTQAWHTNAQGLTSETSTPAKWSAMHCACSAPPQTSHTRVSPQTSLHTKQKDPTSGSPTESRFPSCRLQPIRISTCSSMCSAQRLRFCSTALASKRSFPQ